MALQIGHISPIRQPSMASRLLFFVEPSRKTASVSSIAAVMYLRTSPGLLMFTGLAATTAWAVARNCFIPSTLIVKPCQRTAATMQVRVESLSPGSG